MSDANNLPYRRRPLGTKALQRLGAAIATNEPLTAQQTELYQEFIADSDMRRLITVTGVNLFLTEVASPWMPRTRTVAVGRTKTLKTLREKLIRIPSDKLPSIRDVAGVRVVADCSTLELRVLARMMAQAFAEGGWLEPIGYTGEARTIDRLESPMHGYRAIHLVVRLDGAPVEIQLRTELQHAWASLMELLGDRWGREPRYGQELVELDPDLRELKDAVIRRMMGLSELIQSVEDGISLFATKHINVDPSYYAESMPPEVLAAIEQRGTELDELEALGKDRVRRSLSELQDILESIERVGGRENGD